jgi:plastocyanin
MHHQIKIKKSSFDPSKLKISPGDSISWLNQDTQTHTATADDGTIFDTGDIDAGAESEHKTIAVIDAKGIAYHCEIHPHMKAELTLA